MLEQEGVKCGRMELPSKGRTLKVAGRVGVGFTWHVEKGVGKCTPIFSGIRVTLILRKKN